MVGHLKAEAAAALAASATDAAPGAYQRVTEDGVTYDVRDNATSATDDEWTADDERRARLRDQRRAASATDEGPREATPEETEAAEEAIAAADRREIVARGNHRIGYRGVITVDGLDVLTCPHRGLERHNTTSEARICVDRTAQDIIASGAYV
jgi:hypothetical protein